MIQLIVKLGLTKAVISITLHTEVIYEPRSFGGIVLCDPFVIQGTGIIAFLIEHYSKSTPSRPLLWDNLANVQLEEGRGVRMLENDYIETQQ